MFYSVNIMPICLIFKDENNDSRLSLSILGKHQPEASHEGRDEVLVVSLSRGHKTEHS